MSFAKTPFTPFWLGCALFFVGFVLLPIEASSGQNNSISYFDKRFKNTAIDISFLNTREQITYIVFNHYIKKYESDFSYAKKHPESDVGFMTENPDQLIFLTDYDRALSDRYISLFKNSIIPVVSYDRVDPKNPYRADQRGFYRFSDKKTGKIGFSLQIHNVRFAGRRKATVIYSVMSNARSGGGFSTKLIKKRNKWQIVEVKLGCKY